MEVAFAVGLAASATTLLEATVRLYELTKSLPNALDEAKEIKQSLDRVHALTAQLHRLCSCLNAIDCGWNAEDRAYVHSGIRHAVQKLETIEGLFRKITAGSSVRRRWRWIVKDRKCSQSVVQELLYVEISLTLTLSMLSFYSRLQDHGLLKKISLNLSSILDQSQHLPLPVPSSDLTATHTNKVMEKIHEPAARRRLFRHWRTGAGESKPAHRYAISLSRRVQDRSSDYVLAAKLTFLWNRMLVLNLSWRRYLDDRWTFSILKGSGLSVVRYVSPDCEFMVACRKGDKMRMQQLLEGGQASVRDVTTGNYNPVGLAIEGGSTAAVRTLLQHGADADGIFGYNQTSVLAWAIRWRSTEIVRLLLSKRASCEHVTSHGWTPLFYIWDVAEPNEESSTDLITMLAAHQDFNLSHQGIFDSDGAGVIHRAVVFGTAEEVDMLVRVDVSPFTTEGPLCWTAIHDAVFEGKLDTFEVLLSYYRNVPIDTPDIRGWTLLHIAASAGQSALTRRLLELGADPRRKSAASYSHMPEQLYGGCWTPAEVAKAQSEERWLDMLKASKEILGEGSLRREEIQALRDSE